MSEMKKCKEWKMKNSLKLIDIHVSRLSLNITDFMAAAERFLSLVFIHFKHVQIIPFGWCFPFGVARAWPTASHLSQCLSQEYNVAKLCFIQVFGRRQFSLL